MSKKNISAEFNFESKYLEVMGSKMHYVEEGQGDPILFLHGNPTSSYLWRNIIPHLSGQGRCIAVDLIGMGKSDKPDIEYTFNDHYNYLEKFIEKLGLKNITLVIHDWGSGLGFHYAHLHEDNVKGIAFMEAMVKPLEWNEFPPGFAFPFRLMRAPFIGWFMISVMNIFLNVMVQKLTERKYTTKELKIIKSPYPTIKSRKPIRVWPQEIPIAGQPKRMYAIIEGYSQWLQKTDKPMLGLYVEPGGITKEKDIQWIKDHMKNTKLVHLGSGAHYVQEDHPDAIGEAIRDWHSNL